MARFNTRTLADHPDTLNREGAAAYRQEDQLALVSHLLTSFVQDQFYRSADEGLAELIQLISRVDPGFAARAAVYARREFGMRSVTHVVAGQIAATVKGEEWTKRFFDAVVVRPDDITEILGFYASAYGLHPLPNSLKKGLAAALRRFDAYELAKYRGEGRLVSLMDAVNLCRPLPTPAISRLMTGTLPPADTWEVALTQAGRRTRDPNELAALRRQAWHRLLAEDKLGYMALLRNLRAIVRTFDAQLLQLAERKLVDADAIRSSRVFPFRIAVALDLLRPIAPPGIARALEAAVELSFANVPQMSRRTLIAVDCSGSMTGGGRVPPLDRAILLAAAFVKRNDCDVMLFSDDAWYVQVDRAASLDAARQRIWAAVRPSGTRFTAIFDKATKPYDRVIILSDMQAWLPDWCGSTTPTPALERYRRRTGCDPKVFCLDLAGYGTAQFPARRVCQLAGFSDKVFDLMAALESDLDALIETIEAVEL